jgi:hypothetical protein
MRLRTLVPLVGLLALTACKDEKAEAPPTNPPPPSSTPALDPAPPASPTPPVTSPAEKPAVQ